MYGDFGPPTTPLDGAWSRSRRPPRRTPSAGWRTRRLSPASWGAPTDRKAMSCRVRSRPGLPPSRLGSDPHLMLAKGREYFGKGVSQALARGVEDQVGTHPRLILALGHLCPTRKPQAHNVSTTHLHVIAMVLRVGANYLDLNHRHASTLCHRPPGVTSQLHRIDRIRHHRPAQAKIFLG